MGRPGIRLRGAVTGLLVAWAGCGGEAVPATDGDELSGPVRLLDWSVEPVFQVGGAEAPEWAAFGELTDLAFDGSGRLHVLDGRGGRVTILSPRGELEDTLGTPGEGPGELRFPSAMAVYPDGRITVFDRGHSGFVVYGADGTFLHHVPVDLQRFPDPEPPLRVTYDGWIVSSTSTPPAAGEGWRPVARFSALPDQEHQVVFQAWAPAVPATREPEPEVTGGMRVRLPPVVSFHPALLVAPVPGGGMAVIDSTSWAVKIVQPDGTLTRTLRRPLSPSPVTEAMREAERRRRLEEALAEPPPFMVSRRDGATASPDGDMVLRFMEARIEGMGFYEVVPVVEGIGVDHAGRIWVGRSGTVPGNAGPTDVVTASGDYIGTLAPGTVGMPWAFGAGGLLAYRGADSLGAPVVTVVRLDEGESR